jgi:hypothetical protein
LTLQNALIPKIVKRVAVETDEIRMESLMGSFDAATDMYGDSPDAAAFLAVQHRLLVERYSDGNTLADMWEAEGWTDLKPDEALMMKYWKGSFVTVTEIQRVLDHQRMECIDVFDPTERRFTIVDRNLAARATRFSRVFGWLTHYPNFSKLGQFCHEVPDLVYREFLDLIREAAAEEGYDPEEGGYKAYMMDDLAGLLEDLAVMPGEKMRAIFKHMDSYHCLATYDIAGRHEEVRHILQAKPDFEWDDREPEEGDPPEVDYYRWSRVGESREIEKDMAPHFRHEPGSEWVGGVGNIKLYEDKLVFEAFTKQVYGLGKKMLERHFGKLVKFVDEEISEMAGAIADTYEDDDYDGEPAPRDRAQDAIPPEVRIVVMTKFYEERYARFLDEEIPALDGMTPREASAKPEARRMLIDLMKEHIHGIDRVNREEGTDISLDSLLKELGLDELIA